MSTIYLINHPAVSVSLTRSGDCVRYEVRRGGSSSFWLGGVLPPKGIADLKQFFDRATEDGEAAKGRLDTIAREAAVAMAEALAATLNNRGVKPSDLPDRDFNLAGSVYGEEGFVFPSSEDGCMPYASVSWDDRWVAEPVATVQATRPIALSPPVTPRQLYPAEGGSVVDASGNRLDWCDP
jgi:hypothetical protein